MQAWQSVKITDPDHPSSGRAGVVLDDQGGKVLIRLDADGTEPEKSVLAELAQVTAL